MKHFSVLAASIFVIALSLIASTDLSFAAAPSSPGEASGCFTRLSGNTNLIVKCGPAGRQSGSQDTKRATIAMVVVAPVLPPVVNQVHHHFYAPIHYRYHPHYHFNRHPHFYFSWFHRSSFHGFRGRQVHAHMQSRRRHH